MIIYKILKEDIKLFMNKLFIENTFDFLEIHNIELVSFINLKIDGYLNEEYKNEYEQNTNVLWSEIKSKILNFIKGNPTPKKINITFILPKKYNDKIHKDAKVCYINLKFENNIVLFTTSALQKEFTLDKSLQITWNEYLSNFFKTNNIPVINEEI